MIKLEIMNLIHLMKLKNNFKINYKNYKMINNN